jgi:hypothetical protein
MVRLLVSALVPATDVIAAVRISGMTSGGSLRPLITCSWAKPFPGARLTISAILVAAIRRVVASSAL